MTLEPSTAAIVVAGGSGERFGRAGGKQLARVAGLPVLSWTLRAVDAAAEIDLIVLVCPHERRSEYESAALAEACIETPVIFAASGDTRQASVRAGLEVLPPSVRAVVVHDGARPLATAEAIARVLHAIGNGAADGAVIGHPSYDTLKLVDGDRVLETPQRSRYWAVQTPQAFDRTALLAAHEAAEASGLVGTDDASLVERNGGKVVVVEGPRDNIKVTVGEDLAYAEAVLLRRSTGEEPCG